MRREARARPAAAMLPLLVTFLLLPAAAGCRSPKRPKAPAGVASAPRARGIEAFLQSDQLQPYLDAYPLAEKGTRVDLLAHSPQRSLHLVQTKKVIAEHHHPKRTEIAYVLTGRGTCYVGGRSYPATPGSTFRIEPGVRHSVHPEEGSTLVAVVYYEPPLVEGDDRVEAP